MPLEFWRWQLAEKFGWTLDYIDSLPMAELGAWFQIEDAKAKAAEHYERKRSRGKGR